MKKLLIVDDHAIVRQGVMRVLQHSRGTLLQLDEASNGGQALEMADACAYDLVLLDLSLPDQNGLEVLKQLHQRNAGLPVIILSTYPEEQYAVRTLRAGAAGYVNKGDAATVLKDAIEKVLAGRRYISPTQAELLADAITETGGDRPLHETLSDREYQMACMMSSGKTLTEIAGDLSLSVKTISTYRTRVLEKLRLRTNADIINYFITHKLSQ